MQDTLTRANWHSQDQFLDAAVSLFSFLLLLVSALSTWLPLCHVFSFYLQLSVFILSSSVYMFTAPLHCGAWFSSITCPLALPVTDVSLL